MQHSSQKLIDILALKQEHLRRSHSSTGMCSFGRLSGITTTRTGASADNASWRLACPRNLREDGVGLGTLRQALGKLWRMFDVDSLNP